MRFEFGALPQPSLPGPGPRLTAREREVLCLLTRGLTDPQIGEALCISTSTASRHVANIYQKLGVNTRAQATAFAYEHGLLPTTNAPDKP
jgi:DNA-binding NarL/FixJ family response regulator